MRPESLIILDDVDDLQQLEALADESNWFGPGSRIIVITEDQELLEQHDIDITYHVDFPTDEEASKIFCRYAFRRSLAPYGFESLSKEYRALWQPSFGPPCHGFTFTRKERSWLGKCIA
ncbi:unnamed protein product [Microthlaspi erraticum]|uniref:NB-ARC domain-containing protein n=1 Tax=Microthlaspi erraticum TaxID=1685480 RepID=A0A6D2KNI2_9BRAS|nr:unnamed protein product [Microthlaspi erraticum]